MKEVSRMSEGKGRERRWKKGRRQYMSVRYRGLCIRFKCLSKKIENKGKG